MGVTKIEWCDYTFNHVRGCTKVSAGCANCYAETLSHRNPGTLGVWGPKGTRVVASESQWKLPLKWDREASAAGERRRVFCASLADVFEEWTGPMVAANGSTCVWCERCQEKTMGKTPDVCLCGADLRPLTMQDVRARLFRLIDATPNLDWLILTKRPENIAKMMPASFSTTKRPDESFDSWAGRMHDVPPRRPNVWLGVSVENQAMADKRIPILLCEPAAVHFLSVEPLLGSVDLNGLVLSPRCECGGQPLASALRRNEWCECTEEGAEPLAWHRLDWVIVGGESGHGARPCHLEWIKSLVDQCQAASVSCFVKQLGSFPLVNFYERDGDALLREWALDRPHKVARSDHGLLTEVGPRDGQPPPFSVIVPKLSLKGGDPSEWPADLRVRDFPRVEVSC